MSIEVKSILTPPIFTHGELHSGHAVCLTNADVTARYWQQRSYGLVYPQSYNALGLPMDKTLFQEGVTPIEGYREKARRIAYAQVSRMEGEKAKLGLFDTGQRYYDFGEIEQRITQEVFWKLYKEGWIVKVNDEFFLDVQRIVKTPDFGALVRSIKVYPQNREENFFSLFTAGTGLKPVSAKRRFATPLPQELSSVLDEKNIPAISPHFDLAVQSIVLGGGKSKTHDLIVCGLGKAVARWPLLMTMVQIAYDGTLPFNSILIHNCLTDEDGVSMHSSHNNMVTLDDLFDGLERMFQDAVRYYAVRSTSTSETIKHHPHYLVEGRRLIHTLEIAAKRLLSKMEVQQLKWDHTLAELPTDYQQLMEAYAFNRALRGLEVSAKSLPEKISQASPEDAQDLKCQYQTVLRGMEPFLPRTVEYIKQTYFTDL